VRNVDALLGMASIAQRQGRNQDAMGWYGKVLEMEPRNSIAQAAMANTISQADPVSTESRIKNLLVQQPTAPHLHEALGNIHAERGQWAAAQQSFFEAHRLEPTNPEYAFNLAISLDQLGKPSLALEYYKKTLDLMQRTSTTTIDRSQLESRITQLQ
jgi:Flp pilus assembly protein TadD